MKERLTHKIICGDCIKSMRNIEVESIDLVVTSPPYDNVRNYNGYNFNYQKTIHELFKIVKKHGIVVWIVGDQTINGSETCTSFKQALYFVYAGFNLHDTMIYQKSQIKFPEMNRYYQCFEYMFIFSKGKPETTNLIKDRVNKTHGTYIGSSTYRRKNGKMEKSIVNRKITERYGIRNNIWEYGTGNNKSTKYEEAYLHPAIFPEKLAEDHICSWSKPGEIILDPFLGSGTTSIAAERFGRNSIGIEISKEYCEIAYNRLEREMQQSKFTREQSIIKKIGF